MAKIALTACIAVVCSSAAEAHLVTSPRGEGMRARLHSQETNRGHAEGVLRVCRRLSLRNVECRWHRLALRWLGRELRETRNAMLRTRAVSYGGGLAYWIARQIHAANAIGAASSGDPWPNCPDPYDGSGSWNDTVMCENSGNWYDSPGYYRCGLQFAPSWEAVYGRLCP